VRCLVEWDRDPARSLQDACCVASNVKLEFSGCKWVSENYLVVDTVVEKCWQHIKQKLQNNMCDVREYDSLFLLMSEFRIRFS
jgi:hypothetical protein